MFTKLKNERRGSDLKKIRYMQKQLNLRQVYSIFQCLRQYAQQKKQSNKVKQDNDDKSDLYYAMKLMSKGFESLARHHEQRQDERKAPEEQNNTMRSKVYSVFSAWKFYAKERVLLKKYLFECGESIDEMSLMSTVEMRNNAAKVSSERKVN